LEQGLSDDAVVAAIVGSAEYFADYTQSQATPSGW
jgi:hypothetical protein